MNAINLHPEIHATELRLFGEFCEVWSNGNATETPRITFDKFAESAAMHFNFKPLGLNRPQFIRDFQVEYFQFTKDFITKRCNKHTVVDKITPYPGTCQLVIQKLRDHFPDSKIVNLVRDGRDVVTSGAFDWLERRDKKLPAYRYFIEREPELKLERFFDDEFLQDWALHWKECQTSIEQLAQPPLQIRYEAMIENQASELSRLFNYLDVKYDDKTCQRCAERVTFKKTTGRQAGDADATAKARRGVAGDWQNFFTKRDGEILAKSAGQTLVDLGYETDRSWIDSLPEKLDGCQF